MKKLLLSLLCFFYATLLKAQGENNIWTFGMDSPPTINFNLPSPGITMLPTTPNNTHWASAVCFPNGQLRFYMRLHFNFFTTPEYYIYDPFGNPIAGSNLDTDAGMLDFSMPVVIPKPGNPDQYYIFYGKDDGLRYSVLDMSLNGGLGAVSPMEKDVILTPPGSIFTRLITAVKGCDATWLVIRAQTAGEYYSWPVRATGIDTNKVTSVIGNFPLIDYAMGGFLKASHDGRRLATTNWKGVEMYDFEQCSGKVKNVQVVDTTGNPDWFPAASVLLPTHTRFTGVGFSPDDSKLYVTKNGFLNYVLTAGELFQYDVSLPTLPSIIASRTLIFQNLPYLGVDISGFCNLVTPNPLGEIKAGPDGRVYIDNGSVNCRDTANVPPGFNPAPGFHVLDAPNNAGAACMPVFNRIVYSTGAEFYGSGYPNSFLQNDIVLPGNADHVPGAIVAVPVCFRDSITLSADINAQCIKWDNGEDGLYRTVYTGGIYYVTYYKYCQIITDTYRVNFIKPPELTVIDSSCINAPSGRMVISSAGNASDNFRAIWKDFSGAVIRDHYASLTDTISGLNAGTYTVQYLSGIGCDTTLTARIFEYPPLQIQVYPADTTVRYGDPVMLNASGASFYVWWPAGTLDTAIKDKPIATPLEPILYTVMGMDQNGCRDTGYVNIDIDYNMPDLIPNAFSPNGDGLNDVFKIEGLTYQKIKVFKIFNRYGQEIFSTMDAAKGWDGTQNGKACDVGTYHYLIQLVYPDNRQKSWKGDVTLIR